MKESFVLYEQAIKLKELGFDWKCNFYYDEKSNVVESIAGYNNEDSYNSFETSYDDFNHGYCDEIKCSSPRLDQAQKWLREVKKIDVLVFNCACGYGWEISKADHQSRGTTIAVFDDNGNEEDSGMWSTYELALLAGIDASLKILIEKEYE